MGYQVKPEDVIDCEIMAIVQDKHHGTQIMMKSQYDGTFFVGLGNVFRLWKHEPPQEYANSHHDWSKIENKKYLGVRPVFE